MSNLVWRFSTVAPDETTGNQNLQDNGRGKLMAGGGSREWRGRGLRAGRRSYHEPGYGSRHRDALGNFFSEPVASSSQVETPYRTIWYD